MPLNIVACALLAIASLVPASGHAIEEPPYTVIEALDNVEIRRYDAVTVARTRVSGTFSKVGNAAFSKLGGYIFGGNERQQKIAMTAPVVQQADQSDAASWWVTFVMPGEHSLETLPSPDDRTVELVTLPARTVAVLPYRGGWSETKYRRNEAELTDRIARSDWSSAGAPMWARYNSPIMPAFLRRNEVHLPVEPAQ